MAYGTHLLSALLIMFAGIENAIYTHDSLFNTNLAHKTLSRTLWWPRP